MMSAVGKLRLVASRIVAMPYRTLVALGPQQAASLHLYRRGTMQIHAPGIKYPITLRRDRGDRGAFDQVLIRRHYDHCAIHALKNPRLIIDAGAHIGLASVFFANLFPEAKIIAVEPEPRNFALLRQNIAPYPNITAIQAAAWRSHATVDASGESWAATVHESTTGKIPAIPLPSLANEADILKIDIEGSEKQIFEAGAVPRCKVLFIEIHNAECAAAVRNYVSDKPFTHSRANGIDVFAFPK